MPDQLGGWKLPPDVELDLVEIRPAGARNYSVTDTHVRKSADRSLRVLGKVRNWTDRDVRELGVRLAVGGAVVESKSLSVKARSASQVSFQLDPKGAEALDGYIELDADDLVADDRRYFAWNPPRKSRVLLVAEDRPGVRWPARWFFEQALPVDAGLPWIRDAVTPEGLDQALEQPARRPKVVIACDLDGVAAQTAQALLAFAEAGGQVVVSLNESMDAEALNGVLFADLPLTASGLKYPKTRPAQFELLSWIDLDHPTFAAFQGTRFNDFSALRYFNFVRLTTGTNARALARFEDASPAIVEVPVGAGRFIVWAFPVRLDWTNLPKNPRFVPMVYETLAYLTDLKEGAVEWEVGARVPGDALVTDASGLSEVLLPGAASSVETQVGVDPDVVVRAPGFFRTRAAGEAVWRQIDAVNVDPSEGDLTPVPLAEFELKLASAPMLSAGPRDPGLVGTQVDKEGYLIEKEYGRSALLALFALVLVESWYMLTLRG